MATPVFKVGELVKITHGDNCYPSYIKWANDHLPPHHYWDRGSPKQGIICEVVAADKHGMVPRIIYGVREIGTSRMFVMSDDGLELYKGSTIPKATATPPEPDDKWNKVCSRCGSPAYQGLGPIKCSKNCML